MRYAVFFITSFILFIPACGPRYQAKSIKEVNVPPFASLNQHNVELSVARMNKKDANQLFDNRGGRLIRKKKSPALLLLTITNNRRNSIVLNEKNITVPLMNRTTIANRLHSHTKRRIICITAMTIAGAAITFIAAAYISIIGAVGAIPGLVKTGYGLLATSGVIIICAPFAGYTQAKRTIKTNSAITQDLETKIFENTCTIAPNQTEKITLAVDYKTYPTHVIMNFIDQQTQEQLPFEFDITKQVSPCV